MKYDKNREQTQQVNRVRVAISHGDFNGINYEIIAKALNHPEIIDLFSPTLYGLGKVASHYIKQLPITDFSFHQVKTENGVNPRRINLLNISETHFELEPGKSTHVAGALALEAIEKATLAIEENKMDVLVTAPFNKQNVQSDDFHFPGHTEYLADKYGVSSTDVLMIMVHENLRIGVVTGHIPLKEVSQTITTELVFKKTMNFHTSLKNDFCIRKPKIAVLGLNPHASDEGLLGTEEKEVILPAIQQLKKEGVLAFGPFPTDGFFASGDYTKFDGIVAMYHDQGLTPFKIISNNEGVNFTAGLPIVRTSPAHGTAYDIVGKNCANEKAFRNACYVAVEVFNNRKEEKRLKSNPLPISEPSEENGRYNKR